jgi:tRNA (cytidine56-2'-O)-methyltransferase
LTARAFGCSGFILADTEDKSLKEQVEKVTAQWGGSFEFEMGVPWRAALARWKKNRGIVVHLTMYGLNVAKTNVVQQIRSMGRNILIVVGSQKVPAEFFSQEFSDYNVAVGGQPHSEVAALAVFLDRLFEGRELLKEFEDARIEVLHSDREKRVVRKDVMFPRLRAAVDSPCKGINV